MMPLGNKNVYRNRGICDWISLNQIHQLQESPPWRNINGLHHSCNVQKSQPILLKRIINQTVFSPVHDNTPYSPTSYTGFTTPADGSGESFSDFVGKTPPARLLVSLFSFVYKRESPTQESAGRAWRHATSSNFCQIAKPTAASAVVIRVYTYKRDRLSRRQHKYSA